MEILFVVIAFILIIGVITLYNAFVWGFIASIMYQWFILPYFELPELHWWHFTGFMFMLNCFIHSDTHQFKDEVKDTKQGLIGMFINPWILLALAWLFKTIIL